MIVKIKIVNRKQSFVEKAQHKKTLTILITRFSNNIIKIKLFQLKASGDTTSTNKNMVRYIV